MLRRHSSVDEPTPLLKTRRFMIANLIHRSAPMVSDWLEEVRDPFPYKLVPSSPPNFYRGCESDVSSERRGSRSTVQGFLKEEALEARRLGFTGKVSLLSPVESVRV